ncbi:MAG: hypothetical protein AAF266_10485 [Planctomycetota bacterium]
MSEPGRYGTTDIRPEYASTVEAAIYSDLWFATLLLPAAIVWFCVLLGFAHGGKKHALLAAAGYVVAVALFAVLAISHIYAVQAVKEANMVTEAEMRDWASDTGVVFAPFVQPIVGAIYCGLHSAAASAVGFVLSFFSGTKRSAAEFMQ